MPEEAFRDYQGDVELTGDDQMVMPGDNTTLKIDLITPVAMSEGLKFAIREGGQTVGAGIVSKLL